MKGEGKMVLKSRMKWVGLVGLFLSVISLFVHFLLARFTFGGMSEYQSTITIFSRRSITQDYSKTSRLYKRLWGPVRQLESLNPDANPRRYYADPTSHTNGYIFVRIQGGFHEIRNSISDVVVVARLLNASLVIPEILSTTSSKGISSQFKSFAYLYDEDQFTAALAKDVMVVKTLPKHLKGERRKKNIPVFKVPFGASPYYYHHRVLPILKRHLVVELLVSEGGCLQAILPPNLEEYQRLRCRVAFHALQFRHQVHELADKILHRLRDPGLPFIAFDPGMTRDALAYYGCAELFQDVHTELIQHRRAWMIKRGIVKSKLLVNSAKRRLNGTCPLTPEEVGILLRAYGYPWDTIIYVSGGEIFGGQRTLVPLRGMFENVVDRTALSTSWELTRLYGREANLEDKYPKSPPSAEEETKIEAWKNAGPRPRPLPPPPARPKSYNIEGWWGWVAESDNEPDSTVMELRTNAHKLLWEAIDYVICVEADVFIPGFERDGKGHPNFASLVMGHRLYQSAALKTYRPDRKEIVKLLEDIREHLYHANHTWLTSIRKHLTKTLVDGLLNSSKNSKTKFFISHPVPECSCLRHDDSSETTTTTTITPATGRVSGPTAASSQVLSALGVVHRCPVWMDNGLALNPNEKETTNSEEEFDDENDSAELSGLFFNQDNGSHEGRAGESNNKEEESNNKEEAPLDDQEELEGGDR